MNNIPHKKFWLSGDKQLHIEPPYILLIKRDLERELENNFNIVNLCRNPTSYTSDFYEYKIALFKNEEPERFLQFLRNFVKSIEISGEISVARNF